MWTDLAREYTILAQFAPAEKALRVALSLAPHDRFVLRSAARFYLHWNRRDEAHDMLRRNRRTSSDPWLLASEIAVADLAGRNSRFVRRAREIISARTIEPAHTAELASAVATLELEAGAHRHSRRLFELSLRDPNENAVAQASWAARRLNAFELNESAYSRARSFEAAAWRQYFRLDWESALSQAAEWQLDEPFASRPAVFGSFVASVVKNDVNLGARFAKRGLAAEPSEPTLLNNLSFALALSGDISGARSTLNRVVAESLDAPTRIAVLATGGLIEYRDGNADGGRLLYESAIKSAAGREHREQRTMGLLFQAREELRFDHARAEQLLRRAVTEIDDGANTIAIRAALHHVSSAARDSGVIAPTPRVQSVVLR
jgi:Flp pilus assembly protein TadD